MPETTRLPSRPSNRWRWLTLLAATAVFVAFAARFYIPQKGFTVLINFGANHSTRFLPEVDPATTFITPASEGYDAQWYAQLAVDPDLRDPRLTTAVDNLPYRARRILFSWTAYALGLGEPRRVLQAFAVQNLLAWFLLGALLLRWLPPTNWGNVGRWLLTMFSFGLVFSVRCALMDGPSLLVIVCGLALADMGRPWWSALVLGIAGLGKEIGVLAGAILVKPDTPSWRGWMKVALRGALLALPLVVWGCVILHVFGPAGSDTGSRAFGLPFVEFWRKATTSVRVVLSDPPVFAYAISGVYTVISLGVQCLFFVLRPRWSDPWWRVGAAFAVLMVFLGESVWEGYPSAATRVLLPMLLAFNLAVPRGWRWLPVLLLGNISILSSPNFVRLPVGIEPSILEVPTALAAHRVDAPDFQVELTGPWHLSEHSMSDSWHWTGGSVEIVVRNPHPFPVPATLSFGLNSRNERAVSVLSGDREVWRGVSVPRRQDVRVENLVLPPGESRLALHTDRPAEVSSDNPDPRPLAFRVLDLKLRVRAPAPPAP